MTSAQRQGRLLNRLRRNTLALMSASLAFMAMLFVATAGLAATPAPAAAPGMDVSADMPCGEHEPICSIDCAVLCHVLIIPAPDVGTPTGHARVSYAIRQAALRSLSIEAEDPPPR